MERDHSSQRRRWKTILVAQGLAWWSSMLIAAPDLLSPPLVVLTETNQTRDDLPVLAPHPDPAAVTEALGRGLSGQLLGLYRMEQTYLAHREGTTPEPAYLLLSTRQGGYARYGFFLGDEEKRGVAFVDLHKDWPVVGRFGAMDQIFPHELSHAIRRQLAGPLEDGGTNQVHALALRTDRSVAFNEGFAEHFQVMAVDHEDADPTTRALARDHEYRDRVDGWMRAYRDELTALWGPATRMRMGFVVWYSNSEDLQRYHHVRENALARAPWISERLLERDDPYLAYLLEGVSPGDPNDPPKTVARMVATEGVVSHLFWRWATDERLRGTYRDRAFYKPFGVTPDQVGPLENVYLKLFHVFHEVRPGDVLQMAAGYRETFPDEAPIVDKLLGQVFLGQPPVAPKEIWLANPEFRTGTTLFDQFRGLPRVHTFELNAASTMDLVSVPGVDLPLACAILAAGPYDELDALRRVGGITDELLRRFHGMADEMERLLEAEEEEDEETLSLRSILTPYAWRAGQVLLVGALLGAFAYGLVRSRSSIDGRPGWLRCALDGLAASLCGVVAGWAVGGVAALPALIAVGVLFGIPAWLFEWRRTRRPGTALGVLIAWLAAALPAALLITPIG